MKAELKRPKMASEALNAIKRGLEIEVETQYVFAFLRCIENSEKNMQLDCSINKYNEGFTAIKVK